MLSYAVLVIAGLLAGMINAIAGGGTLLSFPALVWLGVPPSMANATATLSWPFAPSYWHYQVKACMLRECGDRCNGQGRPVPQPG